MWADKTNKIITSAILVPVSIGALMYCVEKGSTFSSVFWMIAVPLNIATLVYRIKTKTDK
jgi:hypothetical protein